MTWFESRDFTAKMKVTAFSQITGKINGENISFRTFDLNMFSQNQGLENHISESKLHLLQCSSNLYIPKDYILGGTFPLLVSPSDLQISIA